MAQGRIDWLWQHPHWLDTPDFPPEILAKAEENIILEAALRDMPEVSSCDDILAEVFTSEVVSSYAVEGISLDTGAVRSSVIRECDFNLNIPEWDTTFAARFEREQTAVRASLEAIRTFNQPMSLEYVCHIHRLLAPSDTVLIDGLPRIGDTLNPWGGIRQTSVGVREHGSGRFVFIGPDPAHIAELLNKFSDWWNRDKPHLSPILFSALAHLFFVEIHPFGDGNGRTARILAESALVTNAQEILRPYSLSSAIYRHQTFYYRSLERIHAPADIPQFVDFILDMQKYAIQYSTRYLLKRRDVTWFAQYHDMDDFTPLQWHIIRQMLLDMTEAPWDMTRIERMNTPEATREFADLMAREIIKNGKVVLPEDSPSATLPSGRLS